MVFDTIAAIATPIGSESGVGIIRISGPGALKVIKPLFKPSKEGQFSSHIVRHGWIMDGPKEIDQVLVTYMAAPRTYTGEDVVEISCHGGGLILKNVLELAIKVGARLAHRGEFTKRALLNGKIDLTQAEAVIDLIKARTKQGSLASAAQLKGALSFQILTLRGALLGLLAEIEASIDFPDEIDEIDLKKAQNGISTSLVTIEALISTADLGRLYREGITVVIAGRPNVGKSSLLNALIREDRAIVAEEPGTTRDAIEETLNLRGIPVVLIDTAGIRQSSHKVEMIGIDRAVRALEKADLVLLVMDRSEGITPEDLDLITKTERSIRLIVLNKADKPNKLRIGDLEPIINKGPLRAVEISALNGEGISELEEAIFDTVVSNKVVAQNMDVMVNLRHQEALVRAKELLQRAQDSLEKHMQSDFVSIDIKGAVAALGEVTGENVSDEIIDRIFEEFCVGK